MNLAFRKEPWVTVCAIEPNCGTLRTRQERSFRAVLDPDFFGLFCKHVHIHMTVQNYHTLQNYI